MVISIMILFMIETLNRTIHLKQKENVQSTSVITMKYEMSSNITDGDNNKNDSFVKLSMKKTVTNYWYQMLHLTMR